VGGGEYQQKNGRERGEGNHKTAQKKANPSFLGTKIKKKFDEGKGLLREVGAETRDQRGKSGLSPK